MTQKKARTQSCTAAQARQRLGQATSFLEVGELIAGVRDPSLEHGSVAAAVAILAGIAASDAACCKELKERSRSENHHDAELLLEQITPGGKQAARQLRQLLDLKDTAHYGFISVTTPQLKRSLRQARRAGRVRRGDSAPLNAGAPPKFL